MMHYVLQTISPDNQNSSYVTTTFTESIDSAATLHCYFYLITLLLTYQFCPSRTIELVVYPTCLA